MGSAIAFVDKRNSSRREPLPPVFLDYIAATERTIEAGTTVNITAYLDGRVLEAFVNDDVISSLVYPLRNDSSRIELFVRCDGLDELKRAQERAPDVGAASPVTIATNAEAWSLRSIVVQQRSIAAVRHGMPPLRRPIAGRVRSRVKLQATPKA